MSFNVELATKFIEKILTSEPFIMEGTGCLHLLRILFVIFQELVVDKTFHMKKNSFGNERSCLGSTIFEEC